MYCAPLHSDVATKPFLTPLVDQEHNLNVGAVEIGEPGIPGCGVFAEITQDISTFLEGFFDNDCENSRRLDALRAISVVKNYARAKL